MVDPLAVVREFVRDVMMANFVGCLDKVRKHYNNLTSTLDSCHPITAK